MRKVLFILLTLSLALVSCAPGSGCGCKSDDFAVVESKLVDTTSKVNPVYHIADGLEGSDFGQYFQTLYRLGQFDEMINFTSQKSINKFGTDRILEFYENELDFGYEIKLNSQNTTGAITTLNYDADIFATNKVVRLNVVIENDTCKLVLPDDLNDFPS